MAWQIADSAFPTGAFAHSWGLEAAWQQGEVEGVGALRRFLHASIQQSACGVIPFVNAAHRDPDRIEALDELADAFLTSAVANRASRVQGRTLVATAGRVWPCDEMASLGRRVERLCAHVGPASGATFRAIGLSLEVAQRIVLFASARGMLSAAVRLGIVGSYEAQRLQYESGALLDAELERCATAGVEDLSQPAPILDLLHSGHDKLYSRLFQS
jgi:urease accessory protein